MASTDQQQALTAMPDVGSVYNLIKGFYSNIGESKEMTAKYLEQLQQSIFAWKIADDLLISRYDGNSCVFAAQTLRNKIQTSFHELPPESYESLKNSIINHLKNIQDNTVQTQLCLAITYLAILVPDWSNPIEELFASVSDPSITVEILICLVEELDGNRIKIDGRRRQHLAQYMTRISASVAALFNATLAEAETQRRMQQQQQQPTNAADRLIGKVFRGLGAWIRIFCQQDDVQLIEPILKSIFEWLKSSDCNEQVHDVAADTVCTAAILCEDYDKYQQLAHYLLEQCYQLEPAYHQSVALEELGMTINFTRILTDLAESVVDPIIINEGEGSRLLHLLLNCVGHFDIEVAEITFHFWYRFSELVYKRQLKTFGPVLIRLLTGLTRHCQMDPDNDQILEHRSDMFDFRCRVRDLVREVMANVGAKEYLAQVLASMPQDGTDLRQHWDVIEAQLFMISCVVAEKEAQEDSHLMAALVNYVLSLQPSPTVLTHVQISATNSIILGEIADWFKATAYHLDSVLSFLLAMIGNQQKNEELSSIAAGSLQSIVECCASKHLIGNTNLVQILIQICCQLDFIKNEDAANNLLQCCSAIVSTTNQDQDRLVIQLIEPHLNKLQELVKTAGTGNSSSSSPVNGFVTCFDRIASIFRKLTLNESGQRSQQLISTVNDRLWPLAQHVMSHTAASHPQVIERCCRCLRFVIRCLKPGWLLEPIASHIVPLYQRFPKHSSLLYLGSILVDEFAAEHDASVVNGLMQMLNQFSMTTFQLLTSSQLRHHPDTIDDFFRLCTRILQKCPESFLGNQMLDNILNLTFASLQLDHREANSSVVRFVCELIDTRYSRDQTFDCLLRTRIGQRLVDGIVNATLFHLPTYYVPDMTDILWALISWDRNVTIEWLGNSLKQIPTQNTMTIMSATPEQLQEFYVTVTKATNPKIVATSFRYLARLYR